MDSLAVLDCSCDLAAVSGWSLLWHTDRVLWLGSKVVLSGSEVPPLLISRVAVHYIVAGSEQGLLHAHPCQNLLGFFLCVCVCFSNNSHSD